MVWPTRLRRRALKHAFEEALDDARLAPDGDPLLFDEPMHANPGSAPAVGSFGDLDVASGYVASASLTRAYDAETGPVESRGVERPAEAARKLKAGLGGTGLTSRDLMRLRRRFAAQNHPDRVPPELRDEALAAMSDVNAEIDHALKRVPRP